MASLQQCQDALEQLAQRMAGTQPGERDPDFDRSLSCYVPDLEVTFSGALSGGTLHDITTGPAPKAQIRLTAHSDDLVSLTRGELDFGRAWLSGRVKVEAGVRDLLKLRSLL